MRRLHLHIAPAIGIGIALILAVASCGPNSNSGTVVRIGYLPIYVALPLFVAVERGLFADHGIKVELVRFESSPDIGTALLTGAVDVGASVATSVVLSVESRDPGRLKVFLVDAENPDGYLSSFVVPAGAGINSITDLRGKTIGFFPGPTAATFGRLVLRKFGLDPNADLTIIELPAGVHLAALKAGTVDGLFTYEPIATQAVIDQGAVKLAPGAVEREIINPWQAGVWVLSDKFLQSRPRDAAAVIKAIYAAVDFLREFPDSAKGSLAQFTSIRADVAAATPNIPFTKLGEVDNVTLQRHADILRDAGVVSRSIDVNILMVPASFLPARAPHEPRND